MAEPYGRTDTTVATTSWANASSKGNTAKPQDMKSRNTYIEVKLTSEQWWVLLFVVWIAISFVLITKAIVHNVTTGWHCPRNCDAFLTPFALSIATCVVPVFFCCPVLGAKGVWWLYIKRAADDDKHRQLHRVRKKCCCISISWIPKAANKRKKGSTHDSESVLPSYVKPGTAQEMDRDPGSPGRRRDDGTMHLPQPTERARLIASQHVQPEPQPRPQPEPEPEPETQEAVDAPVATLDLQADRLQQQVRSPALASVCCHLDICLLAAARFCSGPTPGPTATGIAPPAVRRSPTLAHGVVLRRPRRIPAPPVCTPRSGPRCRGHRPLSTWGASWRRAGWIASAPTPWTTKTAPASCRPRARG